MRPAKPDGYPQRPRNSEISPRECELPHIARKTFVVKSSGSSLTGPGRSSRFSGRGSFVQIRRRDQRSEFRWLNAKLRFSLIESI